jgi:hypothetical protein
VLLNLDHRSLNRLIDTSDDRSGLNQHSPICRAKNFASGN